jgi:hypothetical protein
MSFLCEYDRSGIHPMYGSAVTCSSASLHVRHDCLIDARDFFVSIVPDSQCLFPDILQSLCLFPLRKGKFVAAAFATLPLLDDEFSL